MIKRRFLYFIIEDGKININKYCFRIGLFDMIELIILLKKCVYSLYEMENVNILYWFFLENVMYGEMYILLYMIVFVFIKEFWFKIFILKLNDLEVIFLKSIVFLNFIVLFLDGGYK